MINQKHIHPLKHLLHRHYLYFQNKITEDWEKEIVPHSIFHFMPFFQKPLYERIKIKFSEQSETVQIEIEFPEKSELENNFIPLFGDRLGSKNSFDEFHIFTESSYKYLVGSIASGIDFSILNRKKYLSKKTRKEWYEETGIDLKPSENSININHGIFKGSSERSIWDVNDFIKFYFGRNKGLNLQNLNPPKNYKLPHYHSTHKGYTKFIETNYGLNNKFVIKLQGFSKKELSYLRRFFSFDLKKYNRQKNFEFDSSKTEISRHQHYHFMGHYEHQNPTTPSDFIEKILWCFDFENKSFDPKTSVTVETLQESGSFYFFPDKKLIQVNDLSKGQFIPPPKDFAPDEDQDILGKNIKLGHLKALVRAGVFGNNIDEYGNDVDPIRDCFEKLYFYDWNLGVGFPEVIKEVIYEQIKMRMKDARYSLSKEYLKQIGSPYLNYNDLKTAMFKSESFNNTNKFLKICAEFFMKYKISPTVYTSRETETEVLNLKQFINNPEFLKLNKLPAKLKTLINSEDESTNGFVDFCMDLFLDDFTEDLNLELYFWSDSSKTRDLFLEMIKGEFSVFNEDYSDLDDKETRFTLKIEKFDLYKAWTYLSLLEERRQKEK